MFQRFYRQYIRSTNPDPDTRARELVLNCILIGLMALIVINAFNSLFSLIVKHESYVLIRLLFICFLLSFFVILYKLSRHKKFHNAISLFVSGLFFVLAIFVLIKWGLQDPIAASLFCLVIVMAGILIGALYSLYVVLAILCTFLVLILFDTKGKLQPDTSWTQRHISVGDAISFVTLFAVIALVSWLFNRQMEISLKRARASERALRRQRDSLESIVEERTRELRAEQIQKVQQVYRFAELGHLSTAFFHDLASFSTSLSLDTEGLKEFSEPDMVNRIKENVRYINDVVRRVNRHLQTRPQKEFINVNSEIKDVISIVNYEAIKKGVVINFQANQKMRYRTDVTRFRQIITNLLSNSVEAYDGQLSKNQKVVQITATKSNNLLTIIVNDHGKGIPKSKLEKVFEPFYSGKADGTGIGLFIVRQVTEKDLKGTLKLTSNKKEGTTFKVTLPS